MTSLSRFATDYCVLAAVVESRFPYFEVVITIPTPFALLDLLEGDTFVEMASFPRIAIVLKNFEASVALASASFF